MPTASQAARKEISLVILDLDNTLWDWVGIWHASFGALLEQTAALSGVSTDVLKREFKTVHQTHGTAEYAFSLSELPSLVAKHGTRGKILDTYRPAIDAFRAARREKLRLYPGVMDTLATIKARGCILVGYTESLEFYTNYRLRKTGLDCLLDFVYYPPDHDLPGERDALRAKDPDEYLLRRTESRHTPVGELKPNPAILKGIVATIGGRVDNAIYVGDSEMKDVAMAQDAAVIDVWAKYGAAQHREEYALLREVTHWSDADVQREREIVARPPGEGLKPSFVLENGLADLLPLFEFVAFVPEPKLANAQFAVEAWKKTVDVQQHFNDIEMRIRNLAVTLFTAVVSGVAYSMKDHIQLQMRGWTIPLGTCIGVAGAIAWMMFFVMDNYWYHVFLKAAGTHAGNIEKRWAHVLPELSLSTTISNASAFPFFFRKRSSSQRLRLFYWVGFWLLVAAAIIPTFGRKPDPPKPTPQFSVRPISREGGGQ